MFDQIVIRRERCIIVLNINQSIPMYKLVVVTGLSGSGKSSPGFDILFKGGKRQ
jgi:excinuclease ABC subunit A